MQAHWVDFGIIFIIGLSVLTGIFRGFVKELIALCVWGLALWLAYHYSDSIAPVFSTWIQDLSMRKTIAFILILLSTLLLGGILSAILGYILKHSGLSGTDRTLGMVFGFLRGICIVGLLILGIKMTSLPMESYEKNSLLLSRFDPIVLWMRAYMPDFINKIQTVDSNHNLVEAENSLTLVEN